MSGAQTTFIGVDLAWRSAKNHSAVAVARSAAVGAVLVDYSVGLTSLERVVGYIRSHTTRNTVVAIDAPLIIANESGQRPCERFISQRFGSRHAGAHTSNLRLYPDADSVRLASLLERGGFAHAPEPAHAKRQGGCWFFEVYPHPAQVTLFNLPRIIKYKKGRVVERRGELQRLQGYLREVLADADPPLLPGIPGYQLLQRDLNTLEGHSLKQHEDLLDAYFCVYLALFLWRWGAERNEIIGDMATGYIVNPTSSVARAAQRVATGAEG